MSSIPEQMTNPHQQNDISNLSQEEELEVLLAVYVLGDMKGWDFLPPDQVKKLLDNGKIINPKTVDVEVIFSKKNKAFENAALMVDVFMSILINAFEKTLVEQLQYCPKEEWEGKSPEVKYAVDKLVFYMTHGIMLEELPERMYSGWSGGSGVNN